MICPNCRSNNIRVKCGMFCDLYTCNDCGYESRDYLDFDEESGGSIGDLEDALG